MQDGAQPAENPVSQLRERWLPGTFLTWAPFFVGHSTSTANYRLQSGANDSLIGQVRSAGEEGP